MVLLKNFGDAAWHMVNTGSEGPLLLVTHPDFPVSFPVLPNPLSIPEAPHHSKVELPYLLPCPSFLSSPKRILKQD